MAEDQGLSERIKAIEVRCPLREDTVNEQFKDMHRTLGKIEYNISKNSQMLSEINKVVGNGLKEAVQSHDKALRNFNDRLYESEKMVVAHTVALNNSNGKQKEGISKAVHSTKDWVIKISVFLIIIQAVLEVFGVHVDFITPIRHLMGMP